MAYATKANIQNVVRDAELVQLTDFAGTGEIDDAKITEALDKASAMIDSYAGGRYTLPLTVSDQVKDLCVDIAIYKLNELRPPVREEIIRRYDNALKFLKDVSAGRAKLDQPEKLQASKMDVETPDREASPLVFDDDHLKGF